MCDIITSDLTEILTSAYFRKDSSQPWLIKQKKRPVRHQVHRLRCAQHVFHYFESLLSLDKEKKNKTIDSKNNQHRKQYSIGIIQETQWKQLKKKKENNANIEFLTCHIVLWAGFLSQKAIYVTSFYSNKNNRHLKWLPADWPSREEE